MICSSLISHNNPLDSKEKRILVMAMNNGLRSATKLFTASANRGFHSTGVKRMGGGHGHGHDEPYYLHAKHMYNLDRMKHQQIKMPLAVFSAVAIGIVVPVFAVIFQQKKASSS